MLIAAAGFMVGVISFIYAITQRFDFEALLKGGIGLSLGMVMFLAGLWMELL